MKVAIIGGGVGGMALALSLNAAGVDDVDVYEAASDIRALGVGINVLPHAVRELTELGLLDKISAVGIATAEFFYYSEIKACCAGKRLRLRLVQSARPLQDFLECALQRRRICARLRQRVIV